ncbi:MAG: diadenylate cyclase CdaA [Oscillospiraceae bacterium]
MNAINVFLNQMYSVVKVFNVADFIDIILISCLIYKSIKLVRETRAEQLVKGIFLLVVSYFLSVQFGLKTMSFLLKNVFQIGIIALIVLFQPELRRALEKVGRTKVAALSIFNPDDAEKKVITWESAIIHMCDGVNLLSQTKTGALIVVERSTRLGEQIDTGVEINATISVQLLLNIFFVNTPLHDGAVIVRDGKILAAACFLPKPQKEEFIATELGSRHRAAIGISEISDSLTIVVSEETGTISVSENGQLIRNFTKESLKTFLTDKLIPTKETDENMKKNVFRRAKK